MTDAEMAATRSDAMRRCLHAAWPQAWAHASWLEALEATLGLAVPRRSGPEVDARDQAIAAALLADAGVDREAPLPADRLPDWALEPPASMRRRWSIAVALALAADLRRAVSGDAARHWDRVLGDGVRGAVMLACRSDLPVGPPAAAQALRDGTAAAAREAADWEIWLLRLALGLLTPLGAGATQRLRLAWPRALRQVPPFVPDAITATWLTAALKTAGLLLPALAVTDAPPSPAQACTPAVV